MGRWELPMSALTLASTRRCGARVSGTCRTGYACGCPGSVMRMRIPPTNCTPWSHTFLSPHAKVCRQSMLTKTKFVPSTSGINENKKCPRLVSLFQFCHVTGFRLEYVRASVTHNVNDKCSNKTKWSFTACENLYTIVLLCFHNKDVFS